MASSFSEKMKKKKAGELDVAAAIKEELNNVPDNGILEEIAKPQKSSVKNAIPLNEQTTDDIDKNNKETPAKTETIPSSINNNEGYTSYDKAPFPSTIYKPDSPGTVPWNCRMSPEVIEKMEYCAYTHGIILRDFINTILMAEKKYYDEHSEVITIDIVKQNLKKRYTYDNNKKRKGFVLYPECRDVLTTYPQKYGMTMTAFMEFLINKYCD